mmetsp:Transcript_49505/g.79894  ORF Transcript_49505/g.79894 Transcript_49505/m.79894 type:complete len:209 (-) Transcript_49505:45-671(-)
MFLTHVLAVACSCAAARWPVLSFKLDTRPAYLTCTSHKSSIHRPRLRSRSRDLSLSLSRLPSVRGCLSRDLDLAFPPPLLLPAPAFSRWRGSLSLSLTLSLSRLRSLRGSLSRDLDLTFAPTLLLPPPAHSRWRCSWSSCRGFLLCTSESDESELGRFAPPVPTLLFFSFFSFFESFFSALSLFFSTFTAFFISFFAFLPSLSSVPPP